MKKIFTFIVVICATTALWADAFELDGITYYELGGDSVSCSGFTCSGIISIPATVTYQSKTYRVTSIRSEGFSEAAITSITIPNSVTSIESMAFMGCSSLASVTIGNSVMSIGEATFSGCTALTSITVDSANKYYCSIDGVLFDYAKNILIQYPVGHTRTSYTIPNSVKSIVGFAFGYCTSLTFITIPNSVKSIGDGAFYGCSSLASITIPNSVKSIGVEAFYECASLITVSISNSVTSIGEGTFAKCPSLTSIHVDPANKHYCSIDGVLFNYAKDTLIQYPASNARTSYFIPNSVKSIGGGAFAYSTFLTSVTIPNSVTIIEDYGAFGYCSSLMSITCEAAIPPTCGRWSFYNVDHTIPLCVPAGSITAYQGADQWKDFTNIQAITAQAVEVAEIESEPTSTSVVISWPAVGGSANYTIEIRQGSKVICTIVFNAQGQLLSINFPTSAPARGITNAQEAVVTATGWAYTINGLTPGTAYTYSIVAKNAQGTTIDTKNGSFSTTSPTAIENVNDIDSQKSKVESQKILRDGVLIIDRNGVYYNAQGGTSPSPF